MRTKKQSFKTSAFKFFLIMGLLAGLASISLASCGSSGGKSITLYSGRNESLIQPLIERFEKDTGINVNVKYGNSADLALLIQTEIDGTGKSVADVFLSQSPGAIGLISASDSLYKLPASTRQLVRKEASNAVVSQDWVGITARQRVLVYNTDQVNAADLPSSIFDLTDPSYRGRVAVTPTNSSFLDFITSLRSLIGDAATRNWLEGMAKNNSPNYSKNSAVVQAVVANQVEMGLVNHYYLLREKAENPSARAENHFFSGPGSVLIFTGAGILKNSNQKSEAQQLLEYMLNEQSQQYFVEQLREYPLSPNVAGPRRVRPLTAEFFPTPDEVNEFGSQLKSTIQMVDASGLIQG